MANKKHKQVKRNLSATRQKKKLDGFFDGRFVERTEKPKNKYTRKTKHKNKILDD